MSEKPTIFTDEFKASHFVLAFSGESIMTAVIHGWDELLARVHDEYTVNQDEHEELLRRLDDSDAWTNDDWGKPWAYSESTGEIGQMFIERVTEPGSWRKLTAGGEAEPSIVRRQFPDGSVPETLQECAEGWKRHYDRMLDDWNVMRQQRDNALEAEVRALNSIQAMHRDEPSANVSALAAELCRKHNDADRFAVWEIHDVEALIRKQFRESTPSPVIEGYDREAELLKQLAIVQGERDELAKHFYDARLIASNHAEHVSRLKQKLAALEDERDWLKTCTNTRAYGKLQAENDQLRTTVTSLREACEGASQALQSPVRQWDERNNRERQRDFGRTDEPYMIHIARTVIQELTAALQSALVLRMEKETAAIDHSCFTREGGSR